ncbi:MAG: AAA domain-containing protein [Desulfobacterales bacterium]|nr:AAA domain-containing protein [Desulfobacterales bacterium]
MENIKKTIKQLESQLEDYQLFFNSFYNGAIVTDINGIITHLNEPYSNFLKVNANECIGKHCTEVVENTRMHIVAQTGIPEINHTHLIRGQNIVVHRIPVKKRGEIYAVFGIVMFQDVRDVAKLAKKTSFLEQKVEIYEQELRLLRSTKYTIDSIIGSSKVMLSLKKEALRATSNNLPVLIKGESGTGKELFAQGIHHGSPRNLYSFVRINCAAIPQNLLESELFGYEKGAFTGAGPKGKPGKFEIANKGTIFLDEIGDLPLEMQPKLLRVLEEKEFERIGGNKLIKSDFRLIAATNRDLEEMVSTNQFREDLYYRLNVIELNIPPLRQRKKDIIPIAEHILNQMSPDMFSYKINLDSEVKKALKNYNWNGNVRELSNVIERALASIEGDKIRLHHLPFKIFSQKNTNTNKGTLLKEIIDIAEKNAIIHSLSETKNNKAQAADMLGIHRTQLYKKMDKLNISLKDNE